MKKKFLKVVSLSLIALSLVACGNNGEDAKDEEKTKDGKTTISFNWWGGELRHEKYIKAIEAFEKENPDIKVEYEYGTWDDYWKKLATKSASGEFPDVVQMDVQYIAQYGTKNQLADLSDYVGKEISTDDMKESIVDTGKLDGKLYGITPSINTMAMLVCPAAIEKAGSLPNFDTYTFKEWVANIEDVSKATGDYGWMDNNDNITILQYFLRTRDEDLYKYKDKKPEIAFSKDNFVEFMDAIGQLTKDKAAPTAEVASNQKSIDESPFANGNVGYYMTWSNQFILYQEAASEGTTLDLVRPFDSSDGAMYYRPGFFYSMGQISENKEAAAKLIDFMTNSEEANKIIGTERGIPSNESMNKLLYDSMTEDEKKSSDFLDSIADVVGDPSPVPPIGFAELNTTFKEVYAEITYGTMTSEEAYNTFKSKCEEIFTENY